MASKATNNQKDTPKVDRSIILLGWTTKRTKRQKDATTGEYVSTPGDSVTITGTTRLFYSKKVVDWFNIPTFNPTDDVGDADALKTVKVKQHNRAFYTAIDDVTQKNIVVPEFYRIVAVDNGAKARGKSVLVPIGDNKVTAKGNPRTVSLIFPKFFNNIMIAQALGTMLYNATATKKPSYFTTRNGTSYRIPFNQATAPLNGIDCGAWIAGTEVMGTNLDNQDNIPASGGSTASSAGDRDKAPQQ